MPDPIFDDFNAVYGAAKAVIKPVTKPKVPKEVAPLGKGTGKLKLKLGYDNLEDARAKLKDTFCLYKGKAFYVKAVEHNPNFGIEKNKFVVIGTYMSGRNGTPIIDIDDPDFNCSEYNIGYMNVHQAGFAPWLFRIPQKQFHQGLRNTQMKMRASNPAYLHVELRACKDMGTMLENQYPLFKDAVEILNQGNAHLIAFHKNFAMSKDNIHNDYLLEYKGEQIGFTPDLDNVKLLAEHEHLYEALKEAIGT